LKGRKEGKRARKKEKMVRGHAKAIAQEKNAAKSSAKAKSVKRDSSEVCLLSFSGSNSRLSSPSSSFSSLILI
jgi:hypothetical protein